MCGIVGLFIKDAALQPELGGMLSAMLVTMSDRGPDSAGFAVYTEPSPKRMKVLLQSRQPDVDFADLAADVMQFARTDESSVNLRGAIDVDVVDTHAIVHVDAADVDTVRAIIAAVRPDVRVMSVGERVEIYKEVGAPETVVARFDLPKRSGTHGIGHTRMATESAVTTLGAHPFSTGADQCLVHNGSLSNHNNLRRELRHHGLQFETENDTEVAAAYLTYQMSTGKSLDQALQQGLEDLDGFYTFLVGTASGFGVLRDPIACKPAVLAETDQYVAFGSEYRALVSLPGIQDAAVWEPEPATVYFWEH